MAAHRFPALPDAVSITDEEAQIIASVCPEGGLILETGTYKGLGAERIAKHLPEGARLVTLEAFDDLAEQARERLKDDPRVVVITADSTTYTRRGQLFDVIVLDCWDRRAALKNLMPLTNPGCTVFIHDLDITSPGEGFSGLNLERLDTQNSMGRLV
jgi:predicted O-methyltransferase YrrM